MINTIMHKDTFFIPTHKVVCLEQGSFVFAIGTLLQHIGADYYKSASGVTKSMDVNLIEVI